MESGILSKEKFLKLQSILSILFKSKKRRKLYNSFPIPDDLPFEIRVDPDSKTVITIPNWIKTAIPVFKFGHKKFRLNKKQKKESNQTDQDNYNLINELLNLSEKKAYSGAENFTINLEDLRNLTGEFLD